MAFARWTLCLKVQIPLFILLYCTTVIDANLEDLIAMLGANHTEFVAAYENDIRISCDVTARRLERDSKDGNLQKFCPSLAVCARSRPHESCLARVVARTLRSVCCGRQIPERLMPSPRIIGGSPAEKGEFPWIAMLIRNRDLICAAIIVDRLHGITAAHCFDYHTQIDVYQILAGKHLSDIKAMEVGMQSVRLSAFVRHQDYDFKTFGSDIAVIEFSEPVHWSHVVKPAYLPLPDDVMSMYCTVAGWGDTDPSHEASVLSSVLMKVTLRTYSRQECSATFRATSVEPTIRYLPKGMICAANGRMGRKDACQADSGGPLVCVQLLANGFGPVVYGIVSNGRGCAVPGEPGFYTDLHTFRPWIDHTIHSMT